MGIEDVYSVGKDLVKQNFTFCQIESFACWPFPRDTHENLQPAMTLHLPFMCSTCGFFVGKLLTRHLQNTLVHPLKLKSSHSLILIP